MSLSPRLPVEWESLLGKDDFLISFYKQLDVFLKAFPAVIPQASKIFSVFEALPPDKVRCVLLGEEPYPRKESANGIAFWDEQIQDWRQKTPGNALKNILKALVVARGAADYFTPIENVRILASKLSFPDPGQLFTLWLEQGILLLNVSLTFSSPKDKAKHHQFWRPFVERVFRALNQRGAAPHYVLWGGKAARWRETLSKDVAPEQIHVYGHPTYIHHFLDKNRPTWSPFQELQEKTALQWIP